MTLTFAAAGARVTTRAESWHVLSGRIPADAIEGTSRYGDDVWYLGPAERLGHAPRLTIHFNRVPAKFRTRAKELLAQLLDDDLAPLGKPFSISSVRHLYSGVAAFLNFLHSKGLERIGAATQIHFAEYIGYLEGTGHLNARTVRAARLFWEYRLRLSDPMSSDPAAVPFWRAVKVNRGTDENLTERIPEEVLTPLIWWCSRFVEDFAPDLFRARDDYRQRHQYMVVGADAPARRSTTRGGATLRVRSLLDEYRRTGKLLPGHLTGRFTGRPNLVALDREAGVMRGTTSRTSKAEVEALVETNGVDDADFLPTETAAQLLGDVWVDRIAYGELAMLLKHLQTAAHVLIAFFSGMRDSEVKHIERGCVSVDADVTGKLAIHMLDAVTFKGNTESTGISARWVVAPIVHRAVAVLEALSAPEDKQLFKPLREGTSHNRPDTRNLVSSSESIRAYAAFTGWINDYVAEHGRGSSIPEVNGEQWKLTTKQFRRTLAWFISRKPGGIAAGALQYKHLSLQMFRGYAGESESGFGAEVAAQQALVRGEWLGEFAADADSIVGRARDEVVRRLDHMGKALGFAGHLPENPGQLARFLKRHDPYIYRGAAVTCVFDSSKALCLRKSPDAPDFQTCEPLKCGNAVFTPADISVWRERADGLSEVGANESLAPRVRASAADHSARLTKFLDSIEAAT